MTERALWTPTARRTSCSRGCARVPGALDLADHRVPRGGRLLVGDDGRRRLRGQPRLGDLLVRARRHHRADQRDPAARAHAGDVHRDGPAQARPDQGAVPARLHAEADRRARGRDPRDHARRARPARGPRDVRPGHRRRAAGRRARDRQLHGPPAGGRRHLGAPDEHDPRRERPGRRTRRASRPSWSATCPRSSSAAAS